MRAIEKKIVCVCIDFSLNLKICHSFTYIYTKYDKSIFGACTNSLKFPKKFDTKGSSNMKKNIKILKLVL